MGTLAIDIETASPFEEPSGSGDTDAYEWLSIAAAYTDDGTVGSETTVIFRNGGWEREHTADLLNRFIEWCQGQTIERTLTYYGSRFDLVHMGRWAHDLEQAGVRPGAYADLARVLPQHIDIALAAADQHPDAVNENREIPPDWRVYQLEGIDNEGVWYDDYELPPGFLEQFDIDHDAVQGRHIGTALGEWYVKGIEVGLEGTKTHEQLEQLLYDYSISDIADLPALYQALGGETLDRDYYYPFEEIQQ